MNFNPTESNAFLCVKHVLKQAEIKVSDSSLKKALWEHPDFPSLAALIDVLSEFKVENKGGRITLDKLLEIPLPAIAYLDFDRGGLFVTITKIEDDTLHYLVNGKETKEPLSDFNQKWRGVIVLINGTEISGEKEFTKKRIWDYIEKARVPAVLTALVLLSTYFWFRNNDFELNTSFGIFGLRVIGTLISGFLMTLGFRLNDDNSAPIPQMGIFDLKDNKLFGHISWAEHGLFYFGGGLLCFLINKEALVPLLVLSLFSIFFTLCGLLFQYWKHKKLSVSGLVIFVLVVVEFLLGIFKLKFSFDLGSFGLFVPFLIIPALWWLTKSTYEKGYKYDNTHRQLRKILLSKDYIETLKIKAKELPPFFKGMKAITFGKTEATHTLCLVAAPASPEFAKDLNRVLELIEANPGLKLRLILMGANNNPANPNNMVEQLFGLPEKEIADTLKKWLNDPKSIDWKTLEVKPEGIEQTELAMRWIMMANVKALPSYFIENVNLPKGFSQADIPKIVKVLKMINS